ncbi:response regulator [Rhizobium sp. P38BS-XIX]|uniref:response regulator n=1 Tax=Rhizobium sp. P38BS-XIX TaxID=2726740 RepID=UPI00145651D9|nr:response regulator [Rhizobium sp. P38BS-XIX]NLS01284.1 response regulator [Rhizobium sp. P38BS-XIX]
MKSSDFDFLAHEGELATLIRSFDWASTSLGAPSQWPAATKVTTTTILQSPVPIVTLWGEDGIMIYNDAYSVFAGGRHPQLLGSKVREGWPEVADFNDNVMKVGLAGGTLAYVDQELTLFRTGEPEQVFMNLDYSPVMDEDGRPCGVIAIVVETTMKVKAERRIRGEQDRLMRMFEQAPGFMALLSGPEHRFEMANDSYLRFIGKTREAVFGKKLMKALPELKGQGYREHLDGVFETGIPYHGRDSLVRLERHGVLEDSFVDFVFQPVLGDDNRPVGIFVQGHDVTDQHAAQNALRQETRLLGILNRLSTDLSAELDLDTVVDKITHAGVALTGAQFGAFFYNVYDEKGQSYLLYSLAGVPREQFSKFPMPRNTQVFGPTFEGKGVVRSDDITKDVRYGKNNPHAGMPPGHLPVKSYLAVPVKSRSGGVIGGLFFGHDRPGMFRQEHEDLISGAAAIAAVAVDNARLFQEVERELAERRRAEALLQEANSGLEERVAREVAEHTKTEHALRQSQKMEAVGQLTGGIAHDFNNLLQVVSGNLQLLGKDIVGNTAAEKKVANALEGVARGSKLASQLLSFGRRQALEPKVVNIGRFIAGMEELLRRALGEAIEVEIVRSGGLWNTFVDVVQVENAILNLAINARDAMEGRGKLTIEVGNAFLDDTYARLHQDVTAGQYVMLAVTDTGCGMSSDVIAKVFDPFFTTKPVGRGTGLGLSMVYGFVRQSGGHVKIYSEVGEGTTLKLYFPRSHQEEDMIVAIDHAPLVGGTETILVAEDDEQVRDTVVAMLVDLGYKVVKAKDASAALTIIESGIPLDLLFTDVVMPGPLKSADMARQVRERMPDLSILFTSGYTENSIVHGGRLDPGVELLSKPYTREALARRIRHILNNRKQVLTMASETPVTSATSPTASQPEEANGRHRVLLVEDHELIRMAGADMLSELGYDVAEAASAEDALVLLEKGGIDILVSDLGLPGMSGEDFCREVRRRWPQIGIVFATGRNQAPNLEDTSRTALLPKPHGMEELDAALKAVMDA